MAQRKQKQTKSFEWRDLWEGPRKWLLITPACLLLAGAGWWGYQKLTILPPAEAANSTVQEVTDYLGSDRGFIQMPVQQREEYLVRTWQYYAQSSPEMRMQVTQALNQMTPRQKQVFAQAVTGVVKKKVLEGAKQYNSMKSAVQRAQFAQQFYGDFKRMQNELIGGGALAPGMNVTGPLNDVAPTSPQAIHKAIIANTTPHERAEAEPLINTMVDLHHREIEQRVHGG